LRENIKQMKKILSLLGFFCIITTNIYSQTPLSEAADFKNPDLNNDTIHLFEILDSGQYVLIDFFFVNCTPCQEISPLINQAYKDFGCNSADIFFMSISGMVEDNNEDCLEYDETYGVEFPTLSGLEGGGAKIAQHYQIQSYPTVILIAPDGQIIEQQIRPIEEQSDIDDPILDAGCKYSECPLGINDPKPSFFNVFPNPVDSRLGIQFESSGEFSISLVSLLGISVLNEKINVPATPYIYNIKVNDITKGMYTVLIKNESLFSTQKIIIR